MAEETRNLCAQIPASLHAQVREQQEASGKTLSQYMTELITAYYEYEKGGACNMANVKTVAFQIPTELMGQLKAYLEKYNMTQKAFFLDCIHRALAEDAAQKPEA